MSRTTNRTASLPRTSGAATSQPADPVAALAAFMPAAPTTRRTVAAAVVGIALTFALSACGGISGPASPPVSEAATASPSEDTGAMQPGSGTAAPDEADGSAGADGSGAAGAQETPGTDEGTGGATTADEAVDEYDEQITGSAAGDERIELDEEGDGVMPAEALEYDIDDLLSNKYDMDVDDVECQDLTIYGEAGSTTCDVHTPDRTYYGVAAITDIDDEGLIHYELSFPGLNEDLGF